MQQHGRVIVRHKLTQIGRGCPIGVNFYWAAGPEPPAFWTTGLAYF